MQFGKSSNSKLFGALESKWADCDKCAFACHRNNMVWGKGKLDSGIVIIGEAPGKEEDISGQPFVGRAGKILDEGLKAAGLHYGADANCVILNALACRPADHKNGPNRKPEKRELDNCRKRLRHLLQIAKPSLIVLLGNSATEALFGVTSIQDGLIISGVTFKKVVHPMATVYDVTRKKEWKKFWRDLRPTVKTWKHKTTTENWLLPLF